MWKWLADNMLQEVEIGTEIYVVPVKCAHQNWLLCGCHIVLSKNHEISKILLCNVPKMFVRRTNNADLNFNIENIMSTKYVLFSLQGNPYCNYDSKLEDDAKRCYCKQVCLNIPGKRTHFWKHFTLQKWHFDCCMVWELI